MAAAVDAEGAEADLNGPGSDALASRNDPSGTLLLEDATPMLEVHMPHSPVQQWGNSVAVRVLAAVVR